GRLRAFAHLVAAPAWPTTQVRAWWIRGWTSTTRLPCRGPRTCARRRGAACARSYPRVACRWSQSAGDRRDAHRGGPPAEAVRSLASRKPPTDPGQTARRVVRRLPVVEVAAVGESWVPRPAQPYEPGNLAALKHGAHSVRS